MAYLLTHPSSSAPGPAATVVGCPLPARSCSRLVRGWRCYSCTGAVRHEGVPTSEQRRSPALRSRAPSPAAAASHIAFSTLPVAVVVAPALHVRHELLASVRVDYVRASGSGRWRWRRRASGPSWRRGRPCLRALAAIGTGCRFRESSCTEGGGLVARLGGTRSFPQPHRTT